MLSNNEKDVDPRLFFALIGVLEKWEKGPWKVLQKMVRTLVGRCRGGAKRKKRKKTTGRTRTKNRRKSDTPRRASIRVGGCWCRARRRKKRKTVVRARARKRRKTMGRTMFGRGGGKDEGWRRWKERRTKSKRLKMNGGQIITEVSGMVLNANLV